MYTTDDLAAAQAALARWDEAIANSSSNNPDKYQSQRRAAAAAVRTISDELKRRGVLAMTEAEKLQAELDRLYPFAKKATVVEHAGLRYQIQYFRTPTSRSGKFFSLEHAWVAVSP